MTETPDDMQAVSAVTIELEKYANGEKPVDFLDRFNEFPTYHEPTNVILRDIISGFENEIRQLKSTVDYSSHEDLQKQVIHFYSILLSIMVKPYDISFIISSDSWNFFKHDYMQSLTILSSISRNPTPLRTGKRRHSESDPNVPASNKFICLNSEVNLDGAFNMVLDQVAQNLSIPSESTISADKKINLHPFYVEFSDID